MTEAKETTQLLTKVISKGWPENKDDLPNQLHPFFSTRDEYSIHDGLIFRGERVVVPLEMRAKVKMLGIESTLRRARECLFWPGMTAEIKQVVQTCEACRTYERAQTKETLMSHEIPNRQWEKVGMDLFQVNGRDYHLIVDYYSNFWEVDRLHSTSAVSVIKKIKGHFARYGIPNTINTDPGTQYTSTQFREFTAQWDIHHLTNAPKHSQANGKVESAVKAAKMMMKKCEQSKTDPFMALLEIRNTPQQGMDSSPTQRMLGRRSRTLLPTTSNLLAPRGEAYLRDDRQKLVDVKQRQAKYFNKTAKDLPVLEEGDVVRMQPFRLGKKRVG